MPGYIIYGGRKITLEEYLQILGPDPDVSATRLASKNPGDIVKFGKFEMIVLTKSDDACGLLLKDCYGYHETFGHNNDFIGSNVEHACDDFAKELEGIVGSNNILSHYVDLTAATGATDYGGAWKKVSLLTLDGYKTYARILNRHKLKKFWWLSTPSSTLRDKNNSAVMCVGASESIYKCNCYEYCGVRPFCVLRSDLILAE